MLQSSYLDSTSHDGFQYSQAILVENDVFLSEVRLVGEQGVASSSERVVFLWELQTAVNAGLLASHSFAAGG